MFSFSLERSTRWFVVMVMVVVEASIEIPFVRRGLVSQSIQYTYDSVVRKDIGESLKDGVTYEAYLHLPPHSFDKDHMDMVRSSDDTEFIPFQHLCNAEGGDSDSTHGSRSYTHWLHRMMREQQQDEEEEDELTSTTNSMDEYVTQRALLVKDGMCSYEENGRMQCSLTKFTKRTVRGLIRPRNGCKRDIWGPTLYDTLFSMVTITITITITKAAVLSTMQL